MPFLVGLLVILAALVATSLFRLPAALITVAALGLPLLFLIYLMVSRFGQVRLGADDERPQHTNLSWFSMLFAAATPFSAGCPSMFT